MAGSVSETSSSPKIYATLSRRRKGESGHLWRSFRLALGRRKSRVSVSTTCAIHLRRSCYSVGLVSRRCNSCSGTNHPS